MAERPLASSDFLAVTMTPFAQPTVAGIDVGGPAKGFHAVALCGSAIAGKFHSRRAGEVAAWCVRQGAIVIAVDAPCQWRRADQPARAAERELAKQRVACFSTPTEAAARGRAFYTWMFAGMAMFQALASTHPLYLGQATTAGVAIESFPQAVACALTGEIVSAKEKNRVRRALLGQLGIDESGLANIDEVDATLCALAAHAFAHVTFRAYGDTTGGFIITPTWQCRDQSAPPHVRSTPPPVSRVLSKIIAALPALSPAECQTLREHLTALDGARPKNSSGLTTHL